MKDLMIILAVAFGIFMYVAIVYLFITALIERDTFKLLLAFIIWNMCEFKVSVRTKL